MILGIVLAEWVLLLAIVGRRRIREVIDDFMAGLDARRRARCYRHVTKIKIEDELEQVWELPARAPWRAR